MIIVTMHVKTEANEQFIIILERMNLVKKYMKYKPRHIKTYIKSLKIP
jgi:hypothetical protein